MNADAAWSRALAIFQDLADLPSPERDVRVESACGGDEALLRQVLALLEADSKADSPLDAGADQRFSSLLACLVARRCADCGVSRITPKALKP